MKKLRPLLIGVIFATPLLAQSAHSNAVKEGRYALTTLTKYCDAVENLSSSQPVRVFAQPFSAVEPLSSWKEFSGRDAWRRAGRPKPVALVWYKDDAVARVVISAADSRDGQWYADYCYRPDGSLARLRSLPEMQSNCDRSLFHCSFAIRGERLYPPKAIELVRPSTRPVERTPFVDFADEDDLFFRPLESERTSVSYAPLDWPEYRTVHELPFNLLLYVSTH